MDENRNFGALLYIISNLNVELDFLTSRMQLIEECKDLGAGNYSTSIKKFRHLFQNLSFFFRENVVLFTFLPLCFPSSAPKSFQQKQPNFLKSKSLCRSKYRQDGRENRTNKISLNGFLLQKEAKSIFWSPNLHFWQRWQVVVGAPWSGGLHIDSAFG